MKTPQVPDDTKKSAATVIIASGMRRSGSTLQFQLITDVLAAAGATVDAGWVAAIGVDDLRARDGAAVRVIKTHGVPACPAEELSRCGAIVFHVSRDPRDSLVSHLRKYDVAPTLKAAGKFLSGTRAGHRFWTSQPCVHHARYETLVQDVPGEIRRIAEVLGLRLAPAEIERIAASRSLEQQKQRLQTLDWQSRGMRIGADLIDKDSLLHANHIHRGEVGGWRSVLSRDLVIAIEAKFSGFIRDCGYPLQSTVFERLRYRTGRLWSRLRGS